MKRILIADDDSDLRLFLKDSLGDAGYYVKDVKDGADAIVELADERFDLAILDMLMPGMDGIKTGRVLRKILRICRSWD